MARELGRNPAPCLPSLNIFISNVLAGIDLLRSDPSKKSAEQRRKRKKNDGSEKNCKKRLVHQIKKQTHLHYKMTA
jgi:hypothetical protein